MERTRALNRKWLYFYYKLTYSRQFRTVMNHFWRQRAKNKAPGAVHLLTGSPSDRFGRAVSQLWPLPAGVLPCLPPPPHPSPSTYHSLPPSASQSCCNLPLFFFLAFLVSHPSSQSRPPLATNLTMFVHPFAQLDHPPCSFERLVKNHDVRQRRLFFIPILLYSCNIAPIALSTWHATLSRRSRLVSRSLGSLLHPKSLHCRI